MTCKNCIHYGLCEYHTLIDREVNCKNFSPEIVKCKNCRMFVNNKEAKVTYCTRECKNMTVNENDFCSYGERKENNDL